MDTRKFKSLIAGYAIVTATALLFSPVAFGQGTAGGSTAMEQVTPGNPLRLNQLPFSQTPIPSEHGATSSVGIKSNNMDVPGKRTNAEGIPYNAWPVLRVTGDPGIVRSPQISELKTLPDEGMIGMYPSDFPIQVLYGGPDYLLDPAEKVAVFLWFTALLLLTLGWFFYGWYWADRHAPQYLHS